MKQNVTALFAELIKEISILGNIANWNTEFIKSIDCECIDKKPVEGFIEIMESCHEDITEDMKKEAFELFHTAYTTFCEV